MPSLAELIVRNEGDSRSNVPERPAFALSLASVTARQNATAVSLAFS
jgi:hypothetical protein